MTARADRRGALGPWKGQAFLSVGSALYLGPAGDTTPHAHHALQVSVGLAGPFRLRQGTSGWGEYEAAIVPPDVVHQLDGGWADLLLLYLEPERAESHPWLAESSREIQALDTTAAAALRAAVRKLATSPPNDVDVAGFYQKIVPGIVPGREPDAPLDARVSEAVRRLRASRRARRSLIELARDVGLSPSRFRHLFRREVGMSAQSYVVWLRIYEACASLAMGASIIEAALQAGFSDAAHFTRTFRRTFGLAPSQVTGRLTIVGSPAEILDEGAPQR